MMALFVLGIMISLNYKVEMRQQSSLGYQRYQAARELLTGAQTARDNLAARLTALRRQLSRLKANGGVARGPVARKLTAVEAQAGLTAMRGPGLEITLRDSSAPAQPGQPTALYLVHDVDVLRTVNQLLTGGAEAIAINGQRLTAISQIRCAGPTISVNDVRTITPIHILAIGNPSKLAAAVKDPSGIYPLLTAYGIGFAVQTEKSVSIPPFQEGYRFRYAQPINGSSGSVPGTNTTAGLSGAGA